MMEKMGSYIMKKDKSRINLRDIFTKGNFGIVKLGQTIEEVTAILGKPTDIYNSIFGEDDKYNVKFLRYDGYEFWFIKYYDESSRYKLSAFQTRDYLYENGYEGAFKDGIVLDTWIFKFGLTIQNIEQALIFEGLQFVRSREYDFTVLELKNKSKIYFINSDYSDSLLCEGWTYHPKDYLRDV